MSKPYAKIRVHCWSLYFGGWQADLQTDLSGDMMLARAPSRGRALREARMWSRRLGNIPVEVVDE